MPQQQVSQEEPSVLVLDRMPLRRAETMCFLRDWAVQNRVSLKSVTPAEIGIETIGATAARVDMALLSLGAASLTVPPQDQWLSTLLVALPKAPVVVVSDRDDPDEAVSAARAGARGYLPTSSEPEMVLRALSFILKGGSFFPPSALLDGEPSSLRSLQLRVKPIIRAGAAESRSLPMLTVRQTAVLTHLQAGMSNRVIGVLLGVSESTVKEHVRHIMRRLGAMNRTQAALVGGGAGSEVAVPEASQHGRRSEH
jgi:DNA-binding NarL/FixJ family response regulator